MDALKKEESTLANYKESKWEVTVGKKEFILNGKQVEILKNMSLSGKSAIVWFGTFAISIPHISSIERISGGHIMSEFDKKVLERIENE